MVEVKWKTVIIGLVLGVILSATIEMLITLVFGMIVGLFGGAIGFLIATIYVGYTVPKCKYNLHSLSNRLFQKELC